eukprot:gene53639-30887_t
MGVVVEEEQDDASNSMSYKVKAPTTAGDAVWYREEEV